MRARQPDQSGYVVNDGVRVYFEVYGTGKPTLLLLPTWAIVHSRHWKMQIPYLARHYRVVTFDPRGNGRTDRPGEADAYDNDRYVDDALAVLDATDTPAAVLVGHCYGTVWSALLAARHPERVLGLVAIATTVPLTPAHPERTRYSFDEPLDTDEGWAKENRHYWLRDWPGYVEFFVGRMTVEPHSTKVYDDAVGWGLETDGATMARTEDVGCNVRKWPIADREALCRSLTCPVLVICGDRDEIVPIGRSRRLAELTGGDLLMLEGVGHLPHVRHPVVVNHAIRDFVDRVAPRSPRRAAWLFAPERKRRALWVSSPIGLGHVLRDLAIARALRARVPGLEIHWWAQPPVTDVLRDAGEVIHPASGELASESANWESEADAHDLPAFYAFRRMDEIFCANYLLFDEVVRETPYDVWIGDESWEVDYFLHENPERKIAPYAFLTDVIGFLPTDPGDPREAGLCADYNADAIEQRERFPALRDVSLFLGSWAELPAASFGPGLPRIRPWSRRWYDTVPYVLPFDPAAYRDRRALRQRLGYDPDAPLLVAAVGGTAVGASMLELTADAFGRLRKELPEARMVMVTGPRIDAADLPDVEGMDKCGYLPDLFAHLACADAAIVQGGLSTTMELVAAQRPFIYFPLARHWEQQHFVTHRLAHYRAGTRMDYATTAPPDLAAAMRGVLERADEPARYRRIPPGGAEQAATRIAALLTRP